MLKIDNFFGLSIDNSSSDIQGLLDTLDIAEVISKTKVVKTLVKNNGSQAAIVNVAKRQQALKVIKPLLNEELLDYQPDFHAKEVTTSSEHDRRYSSEEHLLEFALLVAACKSQKVMADSGDILSVKQLREAAFKGTRFDRCWGILCDETEHTVSAFRKAKS